MRQIFFHTLLIAAVLGGFCIYSSAQDIENRNPYGRRDEPPPRGVREMIQKMRIEKAKKEYDEMLERGEEAARLSSQVELSYSRNGSLSNADRDRLQALERDIKKIRSELGGGDMDDKDDPNTSQPMTVAGVVTDLKATAETLLDEIKRSTRFTVSVPAIEASNAALRAARFLLGKN